MISSIISDGLQRFKLDRPTNNPVVHRYAAATILKITYGHDIISVDDLFVRLGRSLPSFLLIYILNLLSLAERAGTLTVESGTPAASIVDFFPVLRLDINIKP
jgi:hypothetical protein